jgi:type II secretory pathway pseudopilin PulG
MRKRLHTLTQSGDTIVEVMLALIVVGLAIGLSYGVANRSLRANQQAQERTEATKQIEGQVERLKKRAVTDAAGTGIFNTTSFCLADQPAAGSTPAETNKIFTQPSPPASVTSDPLGGDYNSKCISSNGLYRLSIQRDGTDVNQFKVTARWPSLGSSGKEEVDIKYRVYPTQ